MQRRNIVFWMAAALAVINLFGAAPLLISMSAPPIAKALGCSEPNLSHGVSQCLVLGIDLGPMLGNILGIGFLWFLTILISAIAFGIWLAVLLILLLTSRSRERESRPAAIASDARLVMTVLLAGITLFINLPLYIVTAIRFIRDAGGCERYSDANCILLGFDLGSALHITQRFFELIGEQVNGGAIGIAGWVLLALALWLAFPLTRYAGECAGPMRRISVWVFGAFAAINLLAALPELLFETYRFIIWLGRCGGIAPDSTGQCLILGMNWRNLLITLRELSGSLSFIVPVAAWAILIWLCASLFLWNRYRGGKADNSGPAGSPGIVFRMIVTLAVISFLISFPSYVFRALSWLISLPTEFLNALLSPISFPSSAYAFAASLLFISLAALGAFLIWIVVAVILYMSVKRKGSVAHA